MAIDRQLNGEHLIHSKALWFEMGPPIPDEEVAVGARIGIGYANAEARKRLWRFFQKGNKLV
jgi:3-methyladenine DNA glycosylase Mpg